MSPLIARIGNNSGGFGFKKPRRRSASLGNPVMYRSSNVYTDVASIRANATDIGNGGTSISAQYLYIIINDGGVVGSKCFSAGWSASVRWHYYNGSAWVTHGSYNSTPTSEWDFTWNDDGVMSTYEIDNSGIGGFVCISNLNSTATPNLTYTGTAPTLNSANFRVLY